jgi:murein L,D-transpeptidase YcbB/YkuD
MLIHELKRHLLALPWLVIGGACSGAGKTGKEAVDTLPSSVRVLRDASIPGNFSAQTRLRFDSVQVGLFLESYPAMKEFGSSIRKFYRNRGYAYAWYDSRGRIESCMDLYNRILGLSDDGVPFHVPHLREYRGMIEGDSSLQPRLSADPMAEIMMTAQYLHYAKDAWKGLPESSSREVEWYLPRKRTDYTRLLDSMARTDGTVDAIGEPLPKQYRLLKDQLKRYRKLELEAGWQPIRPIRKRYALGDTGAVVAAIRRYLHLLGDLAMDNRSTTFDTDLEEGVKSFQSRFGLRSDGIVGAGVLRELNTSPGNRIRQIVVNMERTRWLTEEPRGDHLVINIPQYELLVYGGDSLLWSCAVVVGKDANRTAVFQADMRYIVFSPWWNVPASILEKEILPALSRNPNYLHQNDLVWQGKSLRQRPGEGNALGRVKFLFPNSFSMYLHDTPAKSLFKEEKRAFSHGCIRVSEPRRLALHLLRNDSTWTPEKVDAAMLSGTERFVTLRNPVPVSIVYFTAWVDGEGRLQFRDDIYRRDERLMEMIFSKK